MSIEVRGLRKTFGSFVALRDISLSIRPGELVALLGPSGSGKTTLLRVIAGLEGADAGSVLFDGADQSARTASDRGVGFVFQHYALFRHMTVFENVAFGLRVRPRRERPDDRAIAAKVEALLKLVQLEYLGDRVPSQLSGGQRQRVALARALAVEPRILLLDEPFGALDAQVRQELRRWLRRLHHEIQLTSVFVTHDQEEALELADRVVVMRDGRIEQDGTPEAVVEHPASAFVMTFVGHVNVFRGRTADGTLVAEGLGELAPAPADAEAVAYCRPHDLEVGRTERGDGLWARISAIRVAGVLARLELSDRGGGLIQVELSRESFASLAARVGEQVYVRPRRVRVFSPS